MWFYLSALVVLVGAEINAQIEFRIHGRPEERGPAARRRWRDLSAIARRRFWTPTGGSDTAGLD